MTDSRPRPTFGWRVVHSWWLLFPILGLGCLNGTGFIYIGLRARRPDWWIAGIVYLVAGPALFLFASDGGPEKEPNTWLSMGWFAGWVASLIHACIINPAWLRWRSGYVPWHARRSAVQYTGAGYPAPPPGPVDLPAGLAPPPGQYYGQSPSEAPAAPVPQPPAIPVAPVDVNTAEPAQLASLPGFDPDRVRRVLAERQARRGFGSVEEFAAAATLAPHEFIQVRGLVVCTPMPPAPPPSTGRILDV
ncbi:ComEA family DNA-binding protein [Phytohabitans aurantiacus]|uniref:Helix-hairpin-helix DNA-binding motif class 1 domain-containing protein n=1 Tax=Phytohabitans aurantiacus TaxID=3016789 RepID=A0ABQ5RA27_9ACTN|nr:helix-hairpin-helix domain-containing protein [Phytohabitans aurantiacus]GLI03604.1 hypothetical protein Pa4123_88820 [Phytohabitans aurantiacus]